ncbi:MAG: hypothetical protein V3V16_00795 [Melioribacteraceae bacterium]
MEEIINIAINNKLLNHNDSKVIDLLSGNDKTDKIVEILSIEISKLFVELIKLER